LTGSEYKIKTLSILVMAGHSGYPKIWDRVIRVFEISGFEKYNPKFVENNQNPTFRVRVRVNPYYPNSYLLLF